MELFTFPVEELQRRLELWLEKWGRGYDSFGLA